MLEKRTTFLVTHLPLNRKHEVQPKGSMHSDISLASLVLSESVLPKPSQSLGLSKCPSWQIQMAVAEIRTKKSTLGLSTPPSIAAFCVRLCQAVTMVTASLGCFSNPAASLAHFRSPTSTSHLYLSGHSAFWLWDAWFISAFRQIWEFGRLA